MRRFFVLFFALVLATGTTMAQILTEKERQELDSKASKSARKEAKRLMKQGWEPSPGALPVEKQLDRSYSMQYQYDPETGQPLYIMGEAMSTGTHYDAAKSQALELAMLNLVGQIQAEVERRANSHVANTQLSAEEARSITETLMNAQSSFSRKIGRLVPIVELSRTKKGGSVEVLVRLSYREKKAMTMAMEILHEELKVENTSLQMKIEKLGWK